MADYIERGALRKALSEADGITFDSLDVFDSLEIVDSIPSADVAPVLKSHWYWDEDGMDWGIGAWCCDNCKSRAETWWALDKKYNPLRCSGGKFCGNCGAKMDLVI